jgi:hypothetical protein
MREEHFGMAPAEMARAGMIVWVPRGGGQVEIVGNQPALMYDTDDEAVEKISGALMSASAQQRLRDHLATVAVQFSATHFVQEIRDIVNHFEA